MAENTERNSPATNHTNASMLDHFNEGEKIIEFPTESRSNVALVLGNTGAGKSTFVHYTVGDDSQLMSIETINPDTNDPTGDYTIQDTNNRIGASTLASHTMVPEVMFDQETNTSVYDCPGFSDNRNATFDIAGTYFTKKIIERSKNLKFVFVVNYASVTTGADKTDFLLLAKHVTKMIKNFDKFKGGMCLVATKVNVGKSDTSVINTIAAYLTKARKELQKKNETPKSDQEISIIKFIDALLVQNGTNYTKIGFVRQPTIPGPLSEIEAMRTHKLTLLKLLHENTKFIRNDDPADFSYTISADSQNYVDTLMREIHEQVSHKIESIVVAIQQHYGKLVQEMVNKIESLVNSTAIRNINTLEGQEFLDKLSAERKITENFINEMNNATISDLSTMLNSTSTRININSKDVLDNVSTISNLANFLTFLQSFHTLAVPTHQWSTTFTKVPAYLSTSCDHLQATASNAIQVIHDQISGNINAIAKMIKQHYDDLVRGMELKINSFLTSTAIVEASPLEVQIFMDKLDKGKIVIEKLVHEIDNITIADLSIKLKNTVDNLDARSDDISTNISTISNFGNHLKFLQPFRNLPLPTDRWTTSFSNIPLSLSASTNDVRTHALKVAHEIYDKISHNIDAIVGVIKQYYGNSAQQMENTVNSFITTNSTITIDVNPSDSRTFMKNFNDGKSMTENLVNQVKNIKISELSIKLNNTLRNSHIQSRSDMFDNISTISKLESFLLFLQSFNNLTLPAHQWSATFNNAATFFSTSSDHLRENVTNVRNQIKRKINENILESENAIKAFFSTREEGTADIKKLLGEVTDRYDNLVRIQEMIKEVREPEQCIERIRKNLATMGMGTAKSVFSSSIQYASYLEYLNNLQSIDERSMNLFKCSEGLNDVIMYLNDSKKWYSFVLSLYNRLSEYEIQRKTEAHKVIGDKLLALAENENKRVHDTILLKIFLEACCKNLYQEMFNAIEYVILDKPKLNTLKKVILITIKNDIEIQYSQPCESKLVIKGRFVKLSDIYKRVSCSVPIKFIEIFALDKVFIDTTIDKTGEKAQLSIFAPTWDVQGFRKIILDGKAGEPHKNIKAKDYYYVNGNGEDGYPGEPGGPAGNFLGIGKTAINLENLIISAVGGTGGPGMEGGNGGKGHDGHDPTITPVYLPSCWQPNVKKCEDYLPNPIPDFVRKGFTINRFPPSLTHGEIGKTYPVDVYQKGGDGKTGGNGGRGGKGGNPGQIYFSFANTNFAGTFIDTANSTIVRSGDTGSDGFKGLGGMPGKNSNLLNLEILCPTGKDVDNLMNNKGSKFIHKEGLQKCTFVTFTFTWEYQPVFCHIFSKNTYPGPNQGSDGVSGANIQGIEEPEAAVPFDSVRPINEYKGYLIENLSGDTHELDLKNFLDCLDRHKPGIPKHHSRKRRASPKHDSENIEPISSLTNTSETERPELFAKSSSNRVTSPINYAINWLSVSLGQLITWNPISIVKGFTTFPDDASSSSTTFESLTHDNIKGTASSTCEMFNLNETLMLTDFLIKYFTRVKPYNANDKPTDLSELKACVLDIMDKFEMLLDEACIRNNMLQSDFEFDPITLMAKLETRIVNGDFIGVRDVLYESIAINNHNSFDKSLFRNEIENMIGVIVNQQNDLSHNQQPILDYNIDGTLAANMIRDEMSAIGIHDNSISVPSNINLIAK